MIVDARTYTLRPGATPAYLKNVEEVAYPIQKKHGFDLKGYFTVEGSLADADGALRDGFSCTIRNGTIYGFRSTAEEV